MAYEDPGAGALDYFPCRYGKSKVLFRGPRRRLDGAYTVVLGGSETYGKFVADPFPALIERDLGMTVVNFGCMNAGIDVFVNDATMADACDAARLTVIQLVGAHNMTNRFYAVHPRRNDRFLRASQPMKSLFPEIDFTEFHFTRHMLSQLKRRAPERFGLVESELKAAWGARMRHFLTRLGGRSVLLWLTDYHTGAAVRNAVGAEPLLVDEAMVAEVAEHAGALVRVDPSPEATASGTTGMIYPPFDEAAAMTMPGPMVHAEIAAALTPVVRGLL